MWVYLIVFSAANILVFIIFTRIILSKINGINDSQAEEKEERLFKLYGEIENMLDSFEDYVSEVHEESEQSRLELLELSRQARIIYTEIVEKQSAFYANSPVAPLRPSNVKEFNGEPETDTKIIEPVKEPKPSRLSQKDKTELERLSTKTLKVRFLMSRGFSLDEVAREMNIGKGEVRLIADLDKT